MSDKDVRNRLALVCDGAVLTPKTVAAYLPTEVQQFELPLIVIERGAMRRAQTSNTMWLLTTEWRVVIYGAEANVGVWRNNQDVMYDVYDAVIKAIGKSDRLATATLSPLVSIRELRFTGDTGMVQRELSGRIYLAWVITLEIDSLQSAGDGYVC
jgi:hypothetical protein